MIVDSTLKLTLKDWIKGQMDDMEKKKKKEKKKGKEDRLN